MVWKNVLQFIADPRDWARMEGISKAFRDEIRRVHWTQVYSLIIEKGALDGAFSIGVKKGKSLANGDEFAVGDQLVVGVFHLNGALGALQTVAKKANNLKQLHVQMIEQGFDVVPLQIQLTTQLAQLVNRFSATLTEIRFLLSRASVSL